MRRITISKLNGSASPGVHTGAPVDATSASSDSRSTVDRRKPTPRPFAGQAGGREALSQLPYAAEATAGEIRLRAFVSVLPRKAWASSLRSNTWGATPRRVSASSIFRRRNALVT